MGKNIDLLGNEVKSGDVLLELGRGWGCLSGRDYVYSMKLWEMPDNFDGHAYRYSIDGGKHIFAWAHVGNAVKVDMSIMPEGFEYSFKHGMSDLSSKIQEGTLLELIENSDWREHEVKKEQVERFEFMKTLKINGIEDVIKNIDELKKPGYVPREIMYGVLNAVKIPKTNPDFGNFRGEIGIAYYYDLIHYKAIIEALSENPNCFEKAEAGGKN